MAMAPESRLNPEDISTSKEREKIINETLKSTGVEKFDESKPYIPLYYKNNEEKEAALKKYQIQAEPKGQEGIARFNAYRSIIKEAPVLTNEEAQAAEALFNDSLKSGKEEKIPVSNDQKLYLKRKIIQEIQPTTERQQKLADLDKLIHTEEEIEKDRVLKKFELLKRNKEKKEIILTSNEFTQISNSLDEQLDRGKINTEEYKEQLRLLQNSTTLKEKLGNRENEKAKILLKEVFSQVEDEENKVAPLLNTKQRQLVEKYLGEKFKNKNVSLEEYQFVTDAVKDLTYFYDEALYAKPIEKGVVELTENMVMQDKQKRPGKEEKRRRAERARKILEYGLRAAQYPKSKLGEELAIESLQNMKSEREATLAIRNAIKRRLEAQGKDESEKEVNRIMANLKERAANLRGEFDPFHEYNEATAEDLKKLQELIDNQIRQGTASLDQEIATAKKKLQNVEESEAEFPENQKETPKESKKRKGLLRTIRSWFGR